nr:alpha-1-inhibitor 3-like [Cherax quadricarinatus]
MITTPRQWTAEEPNKVCLFTTSRVPVVIKVNLVSYNYPFTQENVQITEALLNFPAGKGAWCEEIVVPKTTYTSGIVELTGQLHGTHFNHTAPLSLRPISPMIFIQTDKSLYLPGQIVQFRILTLSGPYMHISTQKYSLVWITTPSDTRVAQWLNVDNCNGLVHLSFQLADELEQGTYTIHVESTESKRTMTFKVEQYVLPRFEVTVMATKYVLITDNHFTINVCARYTFGQPVNGTARVEVNNGQSRQCLSNVTKENTIFECQDFVFSAAELQVIDCQVYTLLAVARVTEEGTGVELSGEAVISVFHTEVTFRSVNEDTYMKHYLPYTVQVRAELPDKSAASGVAVELCASNKCTVMVVPEDGLLTIVLPSYSTKRLSMKALDCRAGMDEGTFYKAIEHYYSPSNSSLLISAPDGQLPCADGHPRQHMLTLWYSASQPTAEIHLQVVSRGQIQYWQVKEYHLVEEELPVRMESLVDDLPHPPSEIIRGFLSIAIDLPPMVSPTAMVIAWYTRMDGEVVSDARELKIEKCLAYPVALTWQVPQVQPGDLTMFTLSAEPNSLCSLGVVDKSTELLSDAPDPITSDTLFSYVENFKIYPWLNSQVNDYEYCRKQLEGTSYLPTKDGEENLFPRFPFPVYYTNYVDALKMFDESGLYVFTDLKIETRPCEKEARQPIRFFADARPDVAANLLAQTSKSIQESSQGPVTPRTNFPETWLWSLILQPLSGVTEQHLKVPDTITDWVGKAVCVHPEKGVGISRNSSLVTFTPFFLDLTLPPSVKRGEILPVKISLFNYLDRHLPVTVTLQESSDYKILEPINYGLPGRVTACVAAKDKVVNTVKIDFLVLGDVNITVFASVDHASVLPCGGQLNTSRSDALIKAMKVEAEGFPKEKTWNKYACPKELAAEDSLEQWEIAPPSVTVPGSERAWVSVVGDLLGQTLENLGSLIRMPYGCGEQNMINLAPNIFILEYLDASRQTTPELRQKLLQFMDTGYQHELLYRRADGSYSAFGNADPSGSTWLTAFVLKSFAQARKYILVDDVRLNETSAWLKMQQNHDGCYRSVGKVIHKDMAGGISGNDTSVPLTAYVIISLLEAGTSPSEPEVSGALECILSSSYTLDPYVLALEAYALALARHQDTPKVLQQLLNQAVMKTDTLFWKFPAKSGSSLGLAVETAGYAILAMMRNASRSDLLARKVVKWVTAERNGQGGFYSTQDTVVALQALSVYQTLQYQGPLNVDLTVTAVGFNHNFRVMESNKLLQQLVKLTNLPTNVSIDIKGQGCVVVQAVLRYNIPIPDSGQAFSLTVETKTEPDVACITKRIIACVAYILADGASNMAVMEIRMMSGYIPEKNDLEALKMNPTVKRYEEAGSLVSVYMNELTATRTCVDFRVIREVEVENIKTGTVVVYDYYQPEFSVSKSYSPTC